MNAVSSSSELWSVFDDVRLWSEGEYFDDRLVWFECFGIHPSCWTMDNVRKIGENWGPVLTIDNKVDDICSLTHARMLVRTKAQNKIEARIRLLYEHGCCDVWIKEGKGCRKEYCRIGFREVHVDGTDCKQSMQGGKPYKGGGVTVRNQTSCMTPFC